MGIGCFLFVLLIFSFGLWYNINMKKIGVISDIHGNLTALKAVLKLLDDEHCDEIIHTGDVVDIGPNSRECLEILLARNDVTCLLGNHDRDFVLNQTEVRNKSHVPAEHKQQVFATLNDQLRERVAEFPLYTTRNCGGQKLLFTHYAFKQQPFDINVFPFMPLQTNPTVEQFDAIFDGVDADAIFFGHKHEPCELQGKHLYVDVGSVGCHPNPIARAVVIEYDDTFWRYCRVYAPYDMQQTHDQMTRSLACGDHLYNFYFLRNVKDE